ELKVFDEKIVVENLTEKEIADIEKLKQLREARKEEMEKIGKQVEKTEEEIELEETIRKFNPKSEVELKEAKEIKKSYKIDDIVRTPLEIPGEFGRMAAQTAKQVIIQKLREAERDIIYAQYKKREGEILSGIVQKRDGRNFVIDLGNANALLPFEEQIKNERYHLGDRIKIVLLSAGEDIKAPNLIVSRATPLFVEKLFETEIPEIANHTIAIKGIAREAGSRAKVAVHTDDESIDPIGSCIGQKGSRIQTIIAELNGEKIDIIEFNTNPVKYIANALMPARITSVEVDETTQTAVVIVPSDQLSLTIGRDGQNVRLAVKLTGLKINIREQETGNAILDKNKMNEKPAEEKVIEKQSEAELATKETEEKTVEVKAVEVKKEKKKKTATKKASKKKKTDEK
ncbi:transcription termination factor NusA, partial [Candidatus Falkowbacteria bacterium RIFOXYA2_FULL_35_8]